MTFSENISLQKYIDSANQRFDESESRLSEIEGSFQTRMNGKTPGGLVGSMFGTVCWLAVFGASYWYAREYVDSTLCLVYLGVAVALTISLFIDEIISFSYYGKISSYKNSIIQLKNRVSIGRNSIKSNQDTFMSSSANGWHHPLSVGSSIPEEATSIERTINSMESLKGGFINGLKNFLFFTFVVVVTGIGSWLLFGMADEIVCDILGEHLEGEDLNSETLTTILYIGLLVVEIIVVILAKLLWSHTDCAVTNTTLLITPLGPVLFLMLTTIASFLVVLVIWAVSLAIALAGFAIGIVGAIVFIGSVCGGG